MPAYESLNHRIAAAILASIRKTIAVAVALSFASVAHAAVLTVGPTGEFKLPSAALEKAHDGDSIRIDSSGDYFNDVARINRSDLTIEGVGRTRAVLKTDGRVYGKKGVWLFDAGAKNLTLKNLQFEGGKISEADGANAAGLRAQGSGLTIDGCRFTNNQDGILGGAGVVTIRHCEFDHNGKTGLSHNLYISADCTQLVFEFNSSHDTDIGHLLKSRAAVNVIRFNRISDDGGAGSYAIDLCNGGQCDIVGNLIHKSAKSQNAVVISYGEEGIRDPKSFLHVVQNTMIDDRSAGVFVRIVNGKSVTDCRSKNNFFVGRATAFEADAGVNMSAGNVLVATVEKAGFVDAARVDFHLRTDSPAAGKGIAIEGPGFEYVDPCREGPRAAKDKPDAGAFGTANGR